MSAIALTLGSPAFAGTTPRARFAASLVSDNAEPTAGVAARFMTENIRAQMAIAATPARRRFPRRLHRAGRRRSGPGDLGQRQDQGLSAVVLGRAANPARQ